MTFMEHAVSYTGITALVFLGGDKSAFSSTGLVIVGRFVFAVVALVSGTASLRRQKKMVVGDT
jgi:hypothetical protein